MSGENVELVRRACAGWEQGNIRAGAELFDPEIVFESLMPDSNATIVANGLLEVEAFMRELLAQWRDYCSTAGRGRTTRSSSPEPGAQSLP
jgi:hypothetical protein